MKRDTEEPIYEMKEETPLYNLEEETHPTVEEYVLDDEDDEDDDEEEETAEGDETEAVTAAKRPSPFLIMLKTMLGPVEGWKSLKRARLKTEDFAARCFYPIIALAAVSEGSILFYEANMTPADWAKEGLASFVTFFFGYFTVLFLGGAILPAKARFVMKKDIGKQFVMLAMSTLALFWTLIQLLPMLQPVLVFLPLWTIYIVFKGVRILRVPAEVHNSTTGLLCMLIIGVPLLWDWLMELMLH